MRPADTPWEPPAKTMEALEKLEAEGFLTRMHGGAMLREGEGGAGGREPGAEG